MEKTEGMRQKHSTKCAAVTRHAEAQPARVSLGPFERAWVLAQVRLFVQMEAYYANFRPD